MDFHPESIDQIPPIVEKIVILFNSQYAESDYQIHQETLSNIEQISRAMIHGKYSHVEEFYMCLKELFLKIVDRFIPERPAPAHDIDMEEEENFQFNFKITQRNHIIQLVIHLFDSEEFKVSQAKRVFDIAFIGRLLSLLYSDDQSERELLKTLLHRAYHKFVNMRARMREKIKFLFVTVVQTRTQCRGLPQLLDLMGSIVNGFALPIKEDHKQFLNLALIPLLKLPNLKQFEAKLRAAFVNYSLKDQQCLLTILNALLKFWPRTNSDKQVLFLEAMAELLELLAPDNHDAVRDAFVEHFVACLGSPNCQVVEQATLVLRENVTLYKFIAHDPNAYLRLILARRPNVQSDDYNFRLLSVFNMLEESLNEKFGQTFFKLKQAMNRDGDISPLASNERAPDDSSGSL